MLLSFHLKCISEDLAAMLLCSQLIVATQVRAEFEVESEHEDIFFGEVLSLTLLSGSTCTILVLSRAIDGLQEEGMV